MKEIVFNCFNKSIEILAKVPDKSVLRKPVEYLIAVIWIVGFLILFIIEEDGD